MKNLTLAALMGLQVLSTQAKASTVLNCTLSENGQVVQIAFTEGAGAKVALGNQILNGSFSLTDAPAGTRLSGYKNLQVDASYALPDYSKPHNVKASLSLRPPSFNTGFGWINITGLVGTIHVADSGAECKLAQ
jgi:hypothetical protein